jgi:hypothetical protein
MDDDVLSRVALETGVEPTDVAAQLADTVRATLNLESASEKVFEQHLRNLRLWRRVTLKKSCDKGTIPQAPRSWACWPC